MTTIHAIVAVMRRTNDSGLVVIDGRVVGTIGPVLRAMGATALQAARAAGRLRWASDDAGDWIDILPMRSVGSVTVRGK